MRHEESSNFFKVFVSVFISKHNLVFNFHSVFILTEQNNFLIILHNCRDNISKQTHVIVLFNLVNFFRKLCNSFIKFLFSLYNLSLNNISLFSMLFFRFVDYVIDLLGPVVDFLYKCF